ncbi:MAG TPA: hypothetical protein VMM18_03995 [Gemmatimonadaceae bacterium]|nr:hypothetical protein [Gemmatimonadaceae bacterium]
MHFYTATGLLLAAFATVGIVLGGVEQLRVALLLLFAATFVDATDGALARAVDVRRALPWFDGRRLDDIVDFHTYTSIPLLLLWRSDVLDPAHAPSLLVALLASAYGFAQVEAKTSDGYFRGFPSYWNVVALYLHFLRPASGFALAVILVLSLLTFVPSRYLYPSQPGLLNRVTIVLGAVWAAVLLAVLLGVPDDSRPWLIGSLAFPVYYLLASWIISIREARRVRVAEGP